MVVGIFITHLL